MSIALVVNGKNIEVDEDTSTPLLWILRDHLKLTGTKYGCGIGQCGACMIHVDGQAVRSCTTTVGVVSGKSITTIEGLSEKGDHPLQKAWVENQVPQCGYCHSGQIMHAAALLAENKSPTRQQIIEHMDDVLCRCGTYPRVLKAIEQVVKETSHD